jgi:16S rRNA (uracil1498-N3)-methyltransferase
VSHRYRFFAASSDGERAELSERDRRHLERVLRMRSGDLCEVVAGGRVHRARVAEDGLELLEPLAGRPTAPPVAVWLAQAGARADTAVEKLTELGVARIGALVCERSKDARPRLERWRRVAEAAAKQSGRDELPAIEGPGAFGEVVGPEAIVLAAGGRPLGELVGGGGATLLVGPEAGFSDAELALARAAGAGVAGLGTPRLRSETAAVVGAAFALRELGWLR